jgi:hypothetical protein
VEHETIGSALSAYAAQLDRQADEAGIILHEEPKPPQKRIVQLGAGFGGLEGLAEARKLMEQMDSADKPEIVVIVSFFIFFLSQFCDLFLSHRSAILLSPWAWQTNT